MRCAWDVASEVAVTTRPSHPAAVVSHARAGSRRGAGSGNGEAENVTYQKNHDGSCWCHQRAGLLRLAARSCLRASRLRVGGASSAEQRFSCSRSSKGWGVGLPLPSRLHRRDAAQLERACWKLGRPLPVTLPCQRDAQLELAGIWLQHQSNHRQRSRRCPSNSAVAMSSLRHGRMMKSEAGLLRPHHPATVPPNTPDSTCLIRNHAPSRV